MKLKTSRFVTAAICMTSIMMLSGCVSTKTVSAKQAGDENLTCVDLATRLGEVQAATRYAADKRGVSGENVAAALFFWPAILVNTSSTSEMIDSMRQRESTLLDLYADKSCSDEIPHYENEEIAEKMKTGDTLESFN